ncbi:acetyl-CoA carboxylase biotin carboxylase subunit [Pediococcus acidilactici]|uniref:acetyl-CoA carboxylase biotin carboxylase subunit n=1 Tax=Pediococcus acidilactici TaxID=1254 RepID=UPI000FFCD7F9|nr:acetyl-CoA carboxylase biotin carboxylase subunit [Pediococcus acidilactici]QAR70947.1 acetyl-CoA carboxylase biotin carboxylase subunit [Pediococcus acidilactici]
MFQKVLVANRGEIAVQIIRSLHELDIQAVAVYSTADENSLFVRLADEAVCIGGPQPAESYLNTFNIVNAAILTGCDAIHPGYGFLSENAEFARLCEESNLKFIGPSYQTIELMGNKSRARETMISANVPVIPGSNGMVRDLENAMVVAEQIGYPVMLKAADGGGGKGIRRINSPDELKKAYQAAQREAQTSFGNADLYLEKIIENAKHIEMQVIADQYGHYVFLPERDCSLQRTNQKVIEETPCAVISHTERETLGEIVVRAAKAIKYYNTGTIEFLMDQDHHFYFMEMNTRLQVEHTVTEEVTGIELIKEQIKIAEGQKLSFSQLDVNILGHAIECRINAEDPSDNFMPSAGKIDHLFLPVGTMGVRIDSGITQGSLIPPFYDSMIAKMIVKMPTRQEAIVKMRRVLKEFEIAGVKCNKTFLEALLVDKGFEKAQFSTKYIENNFLKEWLNNEK